MSDKLPNLVRIVDALLHNQFYFLQAKVKEPCRIKELVEQQAFHYELHSSRTLYAQDVPETDTIAYFLGPYETRLFRELADQEKGMPLEPEIELFDGLLGRFSELGEKRFRGRIGKLERRVVPYWSCFQDLPRIRMQLPQTLRKNRELYA